MLAFLTATTIADVVYVEASATGANDGSSWTNAFTHLQDAIDAAVSGDEVWIAEGTYRPNDAAPSNLNRYQNFALKNGVAVYGGFAGAETSLEERDTASNPVILSGDLNRDDADSDGDGRMDTNTTENAYNVFENDDLDGSARLDSVVIRGGRADGSYTFAKRGGGMHNDGSSPTLTNCTLTDNSASDDGGGMYNSSYSSPTLINCTLVDNSASDDGGGIKNYLFSSPTLTNCSIAGNSSSRGGAVYSYACQPTLTNCTLVGNSGVVLYNESAQPTLKNCTIAYNSGRAVDNTPHSNPMTLVNCIIWANQGNGGQLGGGDITASHCVIQGEFFGGTAIIDTDPLLLPLGDYGGPTQTLPLAPGSPAIDAALTDEAPAADQRGLLRDASPDIGACEYVPAIDVFSYVQWAAMHGLRDDDALPGSDPDGDGITNLIECGSNLNPNTPDYMILTPSTGTAGLPHGSLTGENTGRRLIIEFIRRRGSSGLVYTPECCSNPGATDPEGWQPMAAPATVTPIDSDWERVIVEDTETVGSQPRRFIRLRIEGSP